jgi:hypothetical protein
MLLTNSLLTAQACMLHCLQEQDVHPLYTQLGSKGSMAVADKATAQQLQALHTENLQLKSVLKQEIEARQQLESQNAALLELLRYAPLLAADACLQLLCRLPDVVGGVRDQLRICAHAQHP